MKANISSWTVLVIMVGAARGEVDQPAGADQVDPHERHVHPSLVTSCVTEQLRSGMHNVKNCITCFEEVGDPLSLEGQKKAKVIKNEKQ